MSEKKIYAGCEPCLNPAKLDTEEKLNKLIDILIRFRDKCEKLPVNTNFVPHQKYVTDVLKSVEKVILPTVERKANVVTASMLPL